MGGPMSYQRMRTRNGLMFRVPLDNPDPYGWQALPEPERGRFDATAKIGANMHMLCGDLNRMERDYLGPNYGPTWQGRDDLGQQVADETDVSAEDVRKVLRYVFFGKDSQ